MFEMPDCTKCLEFCLMRLYKYDVRTMVRLFTLSVEPRGELGEDSKLAGGPASPGNA
jgi:hypothetical protein